MQAPVIKVIRVNEGLVYGQAVFGEVGVTGVAGFGIEADLVAGRVVGVELLEEALVRRSFILPVIVKNPSHGSSSRSWRSFGRPLASLLIFKSSREMKGTIMRPIFTKSRRS